MKALVIVRHRLRTRDLEVQEDYEEPRIVAEYDEECSVEMAKNEAEQQQKRHPSSLYEVYVLRYSFEVSVVAKDAARVP